MPATQHPPYSDADLRAVFDRHAPTEGTPPGLREAMAYTLFLPGKRLRARLLFDTAGLLGLPREAAAHAASALEMVHCFTLIHDDLPCMDDDDERRGKPSNHVAFGEARALLAGDALLAVALDVLASTPGPGTLLAVRVLARLTGPCGVIGGQAAELALTRSSTVAELARVHRLKTSVLFEAALLIPCALAGLPATDPRVQALEVFGPALGLAFQTADDLEDRFPEGTEIPVTHILRHGTREQARARALALLTQGQNSVTKAFGDRAPALLSYASEVQGYLQSEGQNEGQK